MRSVLLVLCALVALCVFAAPVEAGCGYGASYGFSYSYASPVFAAPIYAQPVFAAPSCYAPAVGYGVPVYSSRVFVPQRRVFVPRSYGYGY